ncbi:hypothetical protein ACPV5U_19600 [Vibrio mediterranei]
MDLTGLPIYNKAKVLKGKVTAQYISETDDCEVLLVNDDYEIEISKVNWILWTLHPDSRGEHLVIK